MFLKILKIKTLRSKFTFYFTLTLGSLVFLTLAFLFAFICHEIFDEEDEELEILTSKIHQEVQKIENINKESLVLLNEKMNFLYDSNSLNLGYRFYDKNGEIIKEHYLTKKSPFKNLKLDDSIGKTKVIFISHEIWIFIRAQKFENITIMVSSFHDEEFIERFFVGCAVIFPLILLISFFIGSKLSQIIVSPLKSISEVAHLIETGDMSARIPELEEGDEVSEVISILNRTFNELENTFSRIQQFSSDVAHEMKTPLTAIRGNLEVSLSDVSTKEELKSASATAIEEIMKLNKIIDTLLLMTKPGYVYKNKEFKEFNVSSCIENIIHQIKILADDKEIKLETNIQSDVIISGIENLFSQLCYNLVSNAIKFTEKNGKISVNLKSSENSLTLEIKDNGIGIKREHLEQIFDRFYQVEKSRYNGTGLGLSLVKWIAELHDGTALVTSVYGEGSLFILSFNK